MKKVFVGKFEDGRMVSAKRSKIFKERCHKGLKQIKVAKPKPNVPIMNFKCPNSVRPGQDPRAVDPYDQTNVYVKNTEYKGDGLFAKKNISEGNIIVYYSGLLLNRQETLRTTRNMTVNQM
jgi:hypothetical protein